MIFAFDMDNTLVSTREAVLQAYRDVGVEPPEDFHQKPWHTWLQSKELHDAKNRRYGEIAQELIRPLGLFYVLIGHQDDNYILSGCSEAAWKIADKKFGLSRHCNDVRCGLTHEQKGDYLRGICARGRRPGVYFDDSPEGCAIVGERSGWRTVCVR